MRPLVNSFLTHFISINKSVSSRATKYLGLLVIIMIALFLEAYMHNFNIVYITLFIVFSLAVSGCYFGRKNLYHLSLLALPEGRIFATKPAPLKWRIINHASNPAYDITCTVRGEDLPSESKNDESSQTFKSIEQDTLLTLSSYFKQRGKADWPKVTFESRFPLLHVKFFKVENTERKLIIYPEPKGLSLEQYLKEQPSNYGERSDFEGIRRYDSSDIPSLIHWPSLAKGGDMMSRNFSYTAQLKTLHFDFLSCGENDEARLSQLCLWILECEKQGRDFTLVMPHEIYNSKKETIDAILQKLSTF